MGPSRRARSLVRVRVRVRIRVRVRARARVRVRVSRIHAPFEGEDRREELHLDHGVLAACALDRLGTVRGGKSASKCH